MIPIYLGKKSAVIEHITRNIMEAGRIGGTIGIILLLPFLFIGLKITR